MILTRTEKAPVFVRFCSEAQKTVERNDEIGAWTGNPGNHPEIIFRSALVPFKTQRRGF